VNSANSLAVNVMWVHAKVAHRSGYFIIMLFPKLTW